MVTIISLLLIAIGNSRLVNSHLEFAIYNNEIYSNAKPAQQRQRHNWIVRSYQTLFGLFMLKNAHPNLPNMIATVDGTMTDDLHDDFELGFYRYPGSNETELWIEHDYFGWAEPWIPPFPQYSKEIKETPGFYDWDKRQNVIYWTGHITVNSVRRQYGRCANLYPDYILVDIDSFHIDRSKEKRTFFGYELKPHRMDLRKQIKYKYLIYFPGSAWSSSLKRIMTAGAVLVMPSPNPHETLISKSLQEKCPDCYLTYNYTSSDDMCKELTKIVKIHDRSYNRTAIAQHNLMRKKLMDFVFNEFNVEKTIAYMFNTLTKISKKQSDKDIKSVIKSRNLNRIDCATLKQYAKSNVFETGLTWQYDLWYDNNCTMILSGDYLKLLAL